MTASTGDQAAPTTGAASRLFRVVVNGGRMVTRGKIDLAVPNLASAEGVISAWLAITDPTACVVRVFELAQDVRCDCEHPLSAEHPSYCPAKSMVGTVVRDIGDDSRAPLTGIIVAPTRDPEWVMVAWGAGDLPAREPLDQLTAWTGRGRL